MGCSPARPLNSPIIASNATHNQISDNNVIKIDHRVLSEKFAPIKSNPKAQLEVMEAPDIMAFDPRNGVKKDFDISGIPHYSSDNVTLNGKWVYMELPKKLEEVDAAGALMNKPEQAEKELTFEREIQHKIEKEFVKGSLRCDFELYGHFAEIIFKEMLIIGDKLGENQKKEHFAYPIKRFALRREAYGWTADDGIARPIVREIEDILNFTTGVYTYNFDGVTYTIDLAKNAIINTETAFAKALLKL